jgi:hypothetical protein
MIHRRNVFSPLLFMLLLLSSTSLYAESTAERVDRVKAAFVYNIAKFVTWPEGHLAGQKNLQVCFYKQSALGNAFKAVEGRAIRGRKIAGKEVEQLAQAEQCHILLIAAAEMESYQQDYADVAEQTGVLTIADRLGETADGVNLPGVVINLIRQDAKIGFEVNLSQIESRQLQLNAQLLRLASRLFRETTE